jgi:HAD superfamily hydrolase (TIGR01509 family)
MLTALIFDFDGLILDTETPDYRAWQEIFAAHGCDLAIDVWARNVGAGDGFDPYAYLEEQYGRPVDRAAIGRTARQRFRELLGAPAPLPGVVEYLRAAPALGLQIGLASSSSLAWVGGYLGQLGLAGHFAAICTADDVARTKPAPDLYLAAVERLGVAPGQAVALEDSPNGVRAAKAAGLYAVAVPNPVTALMDLSHADLVLPSLAALPLPDLLARL